VDSTREENAIKKDVSTKIEVDLLPNKIRRVNKVVCEWAI